MMQEQISLLDLIQDQAERLERMEKALLGQKDVLNFEEFCKYVGISKSHGYKLTSERRVPHFCPNGKTLYFNRHEVDSWLLRNKVATSLEIQSQASQRGGAKV
jgi:excisionase family DNA binding protein